MPRPQDNRTVHEPPLYSDFKPIGIQGHKLQQLFLTLDEFEAVRLADHLGFSHADAAEEMEISRSTFSRLVEKARKKIAVFMIEGRRLTIEGGHVHFRNNIIQCQNCGHMFRTTISSTISECPEGSVRLE